eukprot:5142683-Amphidinium_carterae.2
MADRENRGTSVLTRRHFLDDFCHLLHMQERYVHQQPLHTGTLPLFLSKGGPLYTMRAADCGPGHVRILTHGLGSANASKHQQPFSGRTVIN